MNVLPRIGASLALATALACLAAAQGAKKPAPKPQPLKPAPPVASVAIFQSGPYDSTGLLKRKSVQVELKLTAQQLKGMKDMPGGAGRMLPDPGVQRKWLNKFLTVPQQVRYQEIILQRQGIQGIMHPEVAKAVGVTNQQLNQMYALIAGVNERNADLAVADIPAADRIRRGEQNNATIEPGLKKIMTPAQLAKFQKLMGKPFAV